jgi:hypothetical protein
VASLLAEDDGASVADVDVLRDEVAPLGEVPAMPVAGDRLDKQDAITNVLAALAGLDADEALPPSLPDSPPAPADKPAAPAPQLAEPARRPRALASAAPTQAPIPMGGPHYAAAKGLKGRGLQAYR